MNIRETKIKFDSPEITLYEIDGKKLSYVQSCVLNICKKERKSFNELARILNVNNSSMSKCIEKLQSLKLVKVIGNKKGKRKFVKSILK